MLNEVNLIGNAGRDVEFNEKNGLAIARISVATSLKKKDGETETEWHRVVTFGRTAEIARDYLKKGDRVYIQGRLKTTKYTDKEGVERYSTDVIGSRLLLLTSKKERENAGNQSNGYAPASPAPSYGYDEDAPF